MEELLSNAKQSGACTINTDCNLLFCKSWKSIPINSLFIQFDLCSPVQSMYLFAKSNITEFLSGTKITSSGIIHIRDGSNSKFKIIFSPAKAVLEFEVSSR